MVRMHGTTQDLILEDLINVYNRTKYFHTNAYKAMLQKCMGIGSISRHSIQEIG